MRRLRIKSSANSAESDTISIENGTFSWNSDSQPIVSTAVAAPAEADASVVDKVENEKVDKGRGTLSNINLKVK